MLLKFHPNLEEIGFTLKGFNLSDPVRKLSDDFGSHLLERDDEFCELLQTFDDFSAGNLGGSNKVIRVCGDPGTGKTSLIYRAIKQSRIQESDFFFWHGKATVDLPIPLAPFLGLIDHFLMCEQKSCPEDFASRGGSKYLGLDESQEYWEEMQRCVRLLHGCLDDGRMTETYFLLQGEEVIKEINRSLANFLIILSRLQPIVLHFDDFVDLDSFSQKFFDSHLKDLLEERIFIILEDTEVKSLPDGFPSKIDMVHLGALNSQNLDLLLSAKGVPWSGSKMYSSFEQLHLLELLCFHYEMFPNCFEKWTDVPWAKFEALVLECLGAHNQGIKDFLLLCSLLGDCAFPEIVDSAIHAIDGDICPIDTIVKSSQQSHFLKSEGSYGYRFTMDTVAKVIAKNANEQQLERVLNSLQRVLTQIPQDNLHRFLVETVLQKSQNSIPDFKSIEEAVCYNLEKADPLVTLVSLDSLERLDQDSIEGPLLKAKVFYHFGLWDELYDLVLPFLKDDLELAKIRSQLLVFKAKAAFNRGFVVEAERDVLRVIELSEHDPECLEDSQTARLLLGQIYMKQMNYKTAEIELRRLGKELAKSEEDAAKLIRSESLLGSILITLSSFEEATKTLSTCLEKSLSTFGNHHRQTIVIMEQLSIALFRTGQVDQAIRYRRQALVETRFIMGPLHIRVSELENDLGVFAEARSNLNEASQWYIKSRNRKIKILGEEHEHVALANINIGSLACSDGYYVRSTHFLKKAIDTLERKLGDNILTANAYYNLGAVFLCQSRFQESLAAIRNAISISQRLDMTEQSDHGYFLSGLAQAQLQLGNYELAHENYTQALAIFDRHLGKDHPESVIAVRGLASLAAIQGDFWLAKMHLERVLSFNEEVLTNSQLVELYLDLGKIYRDLEEREQAESYAVKAYDFAQRLREGHPYQGRVLLFQASIHINHARFDEARKASQFALKIFSQTLEAPHLYYARAFTIVGDIYRKKKLHEEAFAEYEKASKIYRELLGELNLELALTYRRMGLAQSGLANFQKSLALITSSRALMTRIFGSEHHLIGGLSKSLGVLYQDHGEYAKAKPHYRDAAVILAHTFGKRHYKLCHIYHGLGNCEMFLGNLEESEKYYKAAIEIVTENFGPHHTQVGFSVLGLASNYNYQKRYEEAIECGKRSYQIFVKDLGKENIILVYPILEIGVAYSFLKKHDDAYFYLNQGLQLAIAKQSDFEAECQLKIAIHFKNVKQYDQARTALERALEIYPESTDAAVYIGSKTGSARFRQNSGRGERWLKKSRQR